MKRWQFKKIRLWIAYPLYVWVVVYGYQNGFRFNPGIWLIVAGMLIRLWAAGHITKRSRLTLAGPYAFVRNPLYVGNFLMGLGFCLFCHSLALVAVYIVLFALAYAGTVAEEEQLLGALFNEAYQRYRREVPAYIPRLSRYAEASSEPYSFPQLIKNGELIRVLVTFLALMLIFFLNYRTLLSPRELVFFWGAAGLQAIVLAAVILHRRRFQSPHR